jgi:pyridoxamine 5'-phosphate oxidase
MNIDSIRNEYKYAELSESSVYKNPVNQFEKWLKQALKTNIHYATAMTLTTFGDIFPESRTVLLKFFDSNGFVFFTNYKSNKGKSIERNSAVGLHFFWPELERQIRICGYAEQTPAKISDEYFAGRPELSRVAAWISDQSNEIPSRKYLEEQFEKFRMKFPDGEFPRPEFWGGYRVKPVKIEFWQGRENRLHDRILYELEKNEWVIKRLAP